MSDPLAVRRVTLIESLGVYLPTRELSTQAVMDGCATPIRFPMERMSGIKSRRVGGEAEYATDLAIAAITRCLATSRHTAADVDIIISTSVSRCDGPSLWVSHEPCMAVRLRHHFGFDRAIAFDVGSACAGMFTGINIVQALIARGTIACGLVVSGEYISHLSDTAQKEITTILDTRLACLTLGDAGAAVMLEATSHADLGFEALAMSTFGAHARHCMAHPTLEPHGGVIMHTDALKMTEAATRHGASHALETMEATGWTPESFQHLIMHQTSSTALSSAMREINRVMQQRSCHPGNTIDNLAHRGNTASTSHFVALADQIATGRIASGDRVIFAISGSGLTVGTGLYTLDDLPERFRTTANAADRDSVPRSMPGSTQSARPRVRIESVGTVPADDRGLRDTPSMLRAAAEDCLSRSSHGRNDLGLLISAGVYRSGFLFEPALAALLAGDLEINTSMSTANDQRTLAFDVVNGGVGPLNACYVAVEMIRAGKVAAAMIVASEVENNAALPGEALLGLETTGSALILDQAPDQQAGFGSFFFRSFTDHLDAMTTRCIQRDGRPMLLIQRDPAYARLCLDAIVATVSEFLATEALAPQQVA
ncbi:MAG: 3-oxoacyl-[acyl-carrier-protein] synthase III C-terminal domain-containing protein, partial [Gemmatimonadales bacterium]